MRIASWNVNSVRTRVDRVVAWLERTGTDVLAIQETKARDDQFPYLAFEAAGYEVEHLGSNQWNGVAIASRVGFDDVVRHFPGQPAFGDPAVLEPRAIGATCGGVRVWSLYVPNGRELDHPHYAYKLDWLARLRDQAEAWLADDPAAQICLMGDWNVAPLDTDVWDPAVFAGKTHVSAAERDAFAAFGAAGYTEMTREILPAENTYTYWDYQQLAFPRNKGLRIDFAYASPALRERVTGAVIDRDERKGKGASDHVPIVLDLAD
ncbi:exodeoxyribonuclease III [Sediminihabitans luteus]|uniref:Exodeoxyribonuclease III n=1 Tax=Sediminihabitans luteus TaxID=1138585 RepID=A0A2M9D0E5_9CELL|nr:exodeoxyribonuclease III [Sediminihabitans luteus]PJJ77661.1 exodeoxyribonuclease III [Sediminihabitans luteus]GII98561.1 putative exodeoxyribonuclease III protein XthA [Sediminihabitans luteus]